MEKNFREEMQRMLEEAIRAEKANAPQEEETPDKTAEDVSPEKKDSQPDADGKEPQPEEAARAEKADAPQQKEETADEKEVQQTESPPPETPPERPDKKPGRKPPIQLLAAIAVLLAAVLVFILCHTAKVERGEVEKLHPGSLVMYWKDEPAYGQVVLTKENEIGRIVGLPGDLVFVDGKTGRLFLNSYLVEEENVRLGDSGMVMSEAVTVPADSVFVIGEDRTVTIGQLLPEEEIKGRILPYSKE